MGIITAYSAKKNSKEAAIDIKGQFDGFNTKMVLYFASSIFPHDEISREMQDSFDAKVFGCSTAGEIISGQMLKETIVAMAFDADSIEDVKVEVIEDVGEENAVKKAFSSFEKHYNTGMQDLDFKKYVGIILVDGLSGSEERLMDKIGDLTDVTFIGGSAGDDLKFTRTYVYAGGKAYTNAAILALIKPKAGFGIIKTQSFSPLNKILTATKVNEANREVLEFNHKPASAAYAEAIGVEVNDAPNHFMHNPVGLIAGDELFVRSPQQIQGGVMKFYCNVLEGMDLTLLESKDIVKDTKAALEEKVREMGNISGIVNFHCILRTLELEQIGQTAEYAGIFSSIPTIGFSTYGEEYIGHINQTSTILVFK